MLPFRSQAHKALLSHELGRVIVHVMRHPFRSYFRVNIANPCRTATTPQTDSFSALVGVTPSLSPTGSLSVYAWP